LRLRRGRHFARRRGADRRAVYNQDFGRRTVRIDNLANGNLRVRVFTDFVDPSRRDYSTTEILRHP
jgi:hypothetical protein